jgi:hypothetical protein
MAFVGWCMWCGEFLVRWLPVKQLVHAASDTDLGAALLHAMVFASGTCWSSRLSSTGLLLLYTIILLCFWLVYSAAAAHYQ